MSRRESVAVYLGGEKSVGKTLPDKYEAFFESWELAAVLASLALLSLLVMVI